MQPPPDAALEEKVTVRKAKALLYLNHNDQSHADALLSAEGLKDVQRRAAERRRLLVAENGDRNRVNERLASIPRYRPAPGDRME
jgi:hypothetical protein